MLKIGVFVSGGGSNLQAIIDNVEKGAITNSTIGLVVSDKEGAYALERAKIHGIPWKVIGKKEYLSPEEYGMALLKTVEDEKIDLIVLSGFLPIIPTNLIQAYKNRIINIHPSLIPAFCGKGFYGIKVHEQALERGVKIVGATVHFVDEGTDTGPIIIQKAVNVKEDDTPNKLQLRVMQEAEHIILSQAIHYIANHKVEVVGNKVKII